MRLVDTSTGAKDNGNKLLLSGEKDGRKMIERDKRAPRGTKSIFESINEQEVILIGSTISHSL